MKSVNDKELATVSALAAPERYGYFVRHVADWQEIWALKSKTGFVIVADDDGRELLPVWPHRRYVEAWAAVDGRDVEPVAIPLSRWQTAWSPGLKKDGRAVAVFPIPSGVGMIVEAERLLEDLNAELSQCE